MARRKGYGGALWAVVVLGSLALIGRATNRPDVSAVISPSANSPSLLAPSATVSVSPKPTHAPPERITLPDVTSDRVEAARTHLTARGFRVVVKERYVEFAPTYEQGFVAAEKPAFGEFRPGRRVLLLVQPACTPGYSPCLPPASDYNCSGGEAGPPYTGFHYVTGSDPYGLDGYDNDGRGCE
jgi:hypothetical protein